MGGFISDIVSTGMGLATSKYDQKLQQQNAEYLHKLQMQGSKEMSEFNKGLALEMYHQTASPAAQREQLEAAGLNVGLMYGGKGGGGGATMQPASVPTQSMSQQPIGMSIAQMQQMRATNAQIKNVEADTKKKEAETAKTAGVDTEVAGATLEQIKAQTQNEKIKTAINEYEEDIKEVEATVASMTQMDVINEVKASSARLVYEANKEKNNLKVSDATFDQTIKQIEQSTIEQQLRIAGQKAGLTQTAEQTKKLATEIYQMQQEQGWKERDMTIREKKLLLEKIQTEFSTSNPEQIKQWTSIVTDILKAGR